MLVAFGLLARLIPSASRAGAPKKQPKFVKIPRLLLFDLGHPAYCNAKRALCQVSSDVQAYVLVAFGLLALLVPSVTRAVAVYLEYGSSQACHVLARRMTGGDLQHLGSLQASPRVCAMFGLEVRSELQGLASRVLLQLCSLKLATCSLGV